MSTEQDAITPEDALRYGVAKRKHLSAPVIDGVPKHPSWCRIQCWEDGYMAAWQAALAHERERRNERLRSLKPPAYACERCAGGASE